MTARSPSHHPPRQCPSGTRFRGQTTQGATSGETTGYCPPVRHQ